MVNKDHQSYAETDVVQFYRRTLRLLLAIAFIPPRRAGVTRDKTLIVVGLAS